MTRRFELRFGYHPEDEQGPVPRFSEPRVSRESVANRAAKASDPGHRPPCGQDGRPAARGSRSAAWANVPRTRAASHPGVSSACAFRPSRFLRRLKHVSPRHLLSRAAGPGASGRACAASACSPALPLTSHTSFQPRPLGPALLPASPPEGSETFVKTRGDHLPEHLGAREPRCSFGP